jgi:ATP-dependent exoDNAse (exonuclease V) beta subunit
VQNQYQIQGLEFDHVIIPYSEDPFFSEKNIKVLKEQSNPFSAPTSIVKNCKKDTRRYFLELEELANQTKKAKISEALCLAYVAITRAKTKLSILIGAKKTGISENEISLRTLILDSLGLTLKNQTETIYFDGSKAKSDLKTTKPIQIFNDSKPDLTIEFSHIPEGKKLKGLPILSPSQFVKKSIVSTNEIFSNTDSEVIRLGSEMHKVLENFKKSYKSKEELETDYLSFKKDILISDKAILLLDKFITSEIAAKVFLTKEDAKVFTEFDINCFLNNSIVKGRIDRLVLEYGPNNKIENIEFYDFKLSDIHNEKSASQMSVYLDVLESYFKVNRKDIVGYLISITDLKLKEINL